MSTHDLDGRRLAAARRLDIGEMEWLMGQPRLTTTQRERLESLTRRLIAEPVARGVREKLERDPRFLAAARELARRQRAKPKPKPASRYPQRR